MYSNYRSELDELKKLQITASADYHRPQVESQRTFKFEPHELLRESDLKDVVRLAEDRLRMELNRKVEICMEELRNVPTRR